MQTFKSKITLTMAQIIALSGLMVACTKEVPYKTVYKGAGTDQVQEKSVIDTNAEYLYVGSSDLANQDSTGAANASPYWQGEEKIVKFRFTDKTLQVLQVNEEQRLKDNKTNDKVLFEIPVNHVDYQCAKDRYDKCTNKEEENSEAAWNQKSKFVPSFDGMKSTAISLLPVEMDKVFGSSCFEETASQLLGYDLTADALNVQVQKTFKANLSCIEEKGISVTSLEDMHTQIIYHYSFTKLNTMTSPNYKIVNYPNNDEGVFGFFTTNNRKYDVDYNRTEAMKTQYMNRWNPERKEIVYYLTDNFNKPEMKAVKDASYLAFERVNNGLKAAGLDMRVVLKEPAHKVPGDIRNSMLILVEDPVASGPLGYGPTVTNPRTGEILSGRVAMYYGNYLQNLRYTYDEVVREVRREKFEAATSAQSKTSSGQGTTSMSPSVQGQSKIANSVLARTSKQTAKKMAAQYKQLKSDSGKAPNNSLGASKFKTNDISAMSSKAFAKAMLQTNKQNTARDALSAMSKYCNYPAELFPFNEIVKNTLKTKLGGELKLWNELTTEERKVAMDVLLPEVWMPTLIHELGHNLGLRHNFGGSEDKNNFYNKNELATMGVTHEIPYSSVMDYGYSELNLLPTLGKYDIAALRFGYKREIETTTGELLKVNTTIDALKKDLANEKKTAEFKDYSYCSDEHVDVNPNCKRFDRGTNLTEIATFLTQNFDEIYERRNFRNGRENFSKMQDGAYYGGTWARFEYIRAFMERYEAIKYRFGLADDAKEWTEIAFLKDLKQAAIISGNFFVKVLQTPEQTCAVAMANKPDTIVQLVRLNVIDPSAMSCFDIKLNNPQYILVGETGKSFNSKKDPNSDNNYGDQIDVRGIWPDKLAAARALLNRQIGNSSFDAYEDNYLDLPEVSENVTSTIIGMLFNQVQTEATFHDAQGNVIYKGNINVDVFSSPETMKSEAPVHWIDTPLNPATSAMTGVPMQQTSLQQVLLNIVAKSMGRSQTHKIEGDAMLNAFSVIKTSKAYQLDPNLNGIVKDIGTVRYIALPEQTIAQQALSLGTISELLGKLNEQQLEDLLKEKTTAAQGKTTTPSQFPKEYESIDANTITAFQRGLLPSGSLMNYLLMIMPN